MPTVKEGDCLSSISAAEGLPDYHFLYEHAVNQALKQKRPNPNCLVVGDEVKLPDAHGKTVEKPAGKRHSFVLKTDKPLKLRLVLMGPRNQSLEGMNYELSGGIASKGTCAKGGHVDLVVTPDIVSANLKVSLPAPPTEAPPKPAATPASSGPPPYPPKIDPKEFLDPHRAYFAADLSAEWDLKIGSLPSHNELSGVQARLINLGYSCPFGSPDGEETRKAVSAFQRSEGKHETGGYKDIEEDLKKAHDDP